MTLPASPDTAQWVARRRVRRWVGVAAALGVLALGGFGVGLGVRQARLRADLTAQVAYEDAQARAGAIELVLAAQTPDDAAWRQARAAETAQGWPAPLPAGNLLPTDAAPRLVGLTRLDDTQVRVDVRRTYADATGAGYDFILTQYYQQQADGEWLRRPPSPALLAATTNFEGERVSALLPAADADWLRPALAAADAALAQVCAEWTTCPAGLKVVVAFGAGPATVRPTRRTAQPVAGGYPLILDWPAEPADATGRFPLPASAWAGRPADEAAQAAYTRALTAHLLGYLAGGVSGLTRTDRDYFLDAVVAHVEARLGLSSVAAGQSGWQAHQYVAPDDLWQQALAYRTGPVAGLAERLQVVGLVRLAAPNPEQEGRLLELAHSEVGSARGWLRAALGSDTARQVEADWNAHAAQQLTAPTADDWALAEGLTLICDDGIAVVEAGRLQVVLAAEAAAPALRAGETLFSEHRLFPGEWSADGRYLGLTAVYPPRSVLGTPSTGVVIVDRLTGTVTSVTRAEGAFGLGWSGEGEYLYVRYAPEAGDATGLSLFGYTPATGELRNLLPDSVRLFSLAASSWSADRGALALTLSPVPPEMSAAIITLDAEAAVQPLGQRGHAFAPVFAPGSTGTRGRAAFLTGEQAGFPVGAWALHIIDLESQQVRTVLTSADLVGGSTEAVFAMEWSPDGKYIVFQVTPEGRYVAVTPETGQWRDWQGVPGVPADFSADGQHLMAMQSTGVGMLLVYNLLELDSARDAPAHRFMAHGMVWSPQGHQVALANDLGVFLVDPDSGAQRWLRGGECRLNW